ncbi:MAG: response regulator transcription factor [Cyanobacteria bacterium HKST-UBA03]|nr:response regulator transcription factor [Cyanobacteria bacterium HKST-UBA05]MCA9840544.1 response regulator transcription factor [Cyanobacteria bacterium HKST-UBA03]
MRILIAEDDVVLADGMVNALTQSGYVVDLARTGLDTESMLMAHGYDSAILDLGLPEKEGLDVLKAVRSLKNTVPVMILTARDTLTDRVNGLDSGADDYLTKPFKLEELEARLRALIRRKHQTTTTELSLGDLRFDTVGRCATLNHQPLPLSAREMNVMELLLINSGHVISKAKLIDHLCGWQDDVTDNAIEVYISRLRRKLEPSPSVSLRTIRGIGYMLESTGVT